MIGRKKIRDYTIEHKLGSGRYGVCFLARDSHGRQVVLKRFRRYLFQKGPLGDHHEAVILSGLVHPSIPELLGVVNAQEGYFFVLKYMPGPTLRQLLFREHRIFTEEDIFRVGSQLTESLVYIHSRSVVHGDLSISNIVDDGHRIGILDFGLARYSGEDGAAYDLDYACLGNVLLYLLYSGWNGRKKGAWYDELDLSDEKKTFLKRLLRLGKGFTDTGQMRNAFVNAFRPARTETAAYTDKCTGMLRQIH